MRLSQLSLYDFLADFLPGAIAVLLLVGLLWLLGFVDGSVATGTSFLVVLTGYPVGRTVHAVAGQAEVKCARSLIFDNLAYRIRKLRAEVGLTDSDPVISKEPKVVDRLEAAREGHDGGVVLPNEWIDRSVLAAFRRSDPGEGPLASSEAAPTPRRDAIDWESEESLGQLQRFGFSELFDSSTLYQRYNIIETFYRNLWLVFTSAGLLYLAVALFIWLPEPTPTAYVSSLFRAELVAGSIGAVILLLFVPIGLMGYNPDWRPTILALCWSSVVAVCAGLLGLGLPIELLLARTPQSVSLDPALIGGIGLLLLSTAVLFDLRRVQFKRRQVRAFINDLYRQQRASGDDGDSGPT